MILLLCFRTRAPVSGEIRRDSVYSVVRLPPPLVCVVASACALENIAHAVFIFARVEAFDLVPVHQWRIDLGVVESHKRENIGLVQAVEVIRCMGSITRNVPIERGACCGIIGDVGHVHSV